MLARNRAKIWIPLIVASTALVASCSKKPVAGDVTAAGTSVGASGAATQGAAESSSAASNSATGASGSAIGTTAGAAAGATAGAAAGAAAGATAGAASGTVAGAAAGATSGAVAVAKPQGILNRVFGFGGSSSGASAKSGVGIAANVPSGGGGIAHNPLSAPGASVGATGAAQAASAPVKPAGPADTCFTVAFTHKKMRSHSDDEDCGRHKNLLTLPHPVKGMSGLCVRVNGSPVQFQSVKGKADQVIIGPIAGPTAKITARYCVGKVQCTEECQIPKDEFMDAIGGSNDGELSAKAGQWDPEDAKLAGELNKELAEVETISAGASHGTYVFSDWLKGDESPACNAGRAIASQ